jgi:hypothetical protein
VTPEEGDEIRLSAGLNAQPLAAWEGPVSGLVASPPDADGPGPALALKLESPSDRDASAVSGREAFRIEFSALNLKLLEKGEARMIRPRRPGPSGR